MDHLDRLDTTFKNKELSGPGEVGRSTLAMDRPRALSRSGLALPLGTALRSGYKPRAWHIGCRVLVG